MSGLAAFGIGVGMGLVMMAVVVVYLRHELADGLRRIFGEAGEDDEGSLVDRVVALRAPEPADPSARRSQRSRARAALIFNAVAAVALLVVGLTTDQGLATLTGVVAILILVPVTALFRAREMV